MPRKPRLHVPGAVYHVILRGNNQQDLFFCAADYIHLNQLVDRSTNRLNASVHAFCWMGNHIHLAVQVSDVPLGRLVQWIAPATRITLIGAWGEPDTCLNVATGQFWSTLIRTCSSWFGTYISTQSRPALSKILRPTFGVATATTLGRGRSIG